MSCFWGNLKAFCRVCHLFNSLWDVISEKWVHCHESQALKSLCIANSTKVCSDAPFLTVLIFTSMWMLHRDLNHRCHLGEHGLCLCIILCNWSLTKCWFFYCSTASCIVFKILRIGCGAFLSFPKFPGGVLASLLGQHFRGRCDLWSVWLLCDKRWKVLHCRSKRKDDHSHLP